MAIHRIVFSTTTTSELRFNDSSVTFDGGMLTIWKGGEKVFAIPTGNVVAVERLADTTPIQMPEEQPQAPGA